MRLETGYAFQNNGRPLKHSKRTEVLGSWLFFWLKQWGWFVFSVFWNGWGFSFCWLIYPMRNWANSEVKNQKLYRTVKYLYLGQLSNSYMDNPSKRVTHQKRSSMVYSDVQIRVSSSSVVLTEFKIFFSWRKKNQPPLFQIPE